MERTGVEYVDQALEDLHAPAPIEYERTDRDLLIDILDSQLRTEKLVTEFITAIKPTVEAMSKGGIMGLLGAMRG